MDVGVETERRVDICGAVGRLSAVIHRPAGAAGARYPLVIVLHGLTGNKDERLLRGITERLVTLGIATLRFDFNGHGESAGDFERMTILNEIEDARRVYAYAAALDWAASVSLVGHSQGGVVASMLAGELGEPNIRGLVLLAPAAVLRDDAIRGYCAGSPFNPLDPPEFCELPGGGRLGREYILAAQTLPVYDVAERYTGPVCLIHGTGDCAVPYTCSEHYHRLYKRSELHVLDGYDHGFSQGQAKVSAMVAEFLAKQAAEA